MTRHGAHPAPTASSSSTRPRQFIGSTYICTEQLWKHEDSSYSSPSPLEWQVCTAPNSPAEFQVAPREQMLHPTEFKPWKSSLKTQPPHPPRGWIPVWKAWLELASFAGTKNFATACSTCLQDYHHSLIRCKICKCILHGQSWKPSGRSLFLHQGIQFTICA